MNKEKIVEELDEYVKAVDSKFKVKSGEGDLKLFCEVCGVCRFYEFDKERFDIYTTTLDKYNSSLVAKTGIINKFYTKAIELMDKYGATYTVQVFPNEYGFLYKRNNDIDDVIADKLDDLEFHKEYGYFTKSEIEELKKHDDVAIDWDKAIITEVK